MERIKNEQELMAQLRESIRGCDLDNVVLQAGHFPLLYLPSRVEEGTKKWGEFSKYSLELGCQAGAYAKELGKDVKFAFFVDDHSYQRESRLSRNQRGKGRKQFYGTASTEKAILLPKYKDILGRYHFDESDIKRHDHEKSGREDCLYFSELVLRKLAKEGENACAKEYATFIEDPKYFDKETSHLISFVPQRCREQICKVALDDEVEELSASHVFMETMLPLASREELYTQGRGTIYRRDRK